MEMIHNNKNYRLDIDGLRAIAVLSVIFFHFGFMPYGYLGVDVFFVISGYLITGILYNEISENKFSITQFYMRRIRRILPLSLFVVTVALFVGIFTMLPDDLENLAQSIVATNFSANNILQAITTKNYWDVVNEYKPLMHTWSLGIEEQYYFLYPFLFFLLKGKYVRIIAPVIALLTLLSLTFYFSPYFYEHQKFYYLPFRFFELSLGGLVAVLLKNRMVDLKGSGIFIIGLLLLLFGAGEFIENSLLIPVTVLLSTFILCSYNHGSSFNKLVLENKLFVFLGKISFGLYLWHQLLLAFTRYVFVQNLHVVHCVIIFMLMLLLSTVTYIFIEQPFRNKTKFSAKTVLLTVGLFFALTTAGSLYIYFKAGVLRDYPELGIYKENVKRNMHAEYNDRIYAFENKEFTNTDKHKVLVVGNSFARDFANILLESSFKNDIEISYVYPIENIPENLMVQANYIFIYGQTERHDEIQNFNPKIWHIGTKNFGVNNGVFYNYRGENYIQQTTVLEDGYYTQNKNAKTKWQDRYFDFITPVLTENNQVPIFTPSGEFISQDCRHLTIYGAKFYANIFEEKLKRIFK